MRRNNDFRDWKTRPITADLPATPHGMGPSLEASVSHEMEKNEWWAVTGSNRRPSRCKRDALPAELTAPFQSALNAQKKRQGQHLGAELF